MSVVVQKRLVADPSLGIMEIQKVILSHFNACKDFDIYSALDCPGHQRWSWKTAPNVSWMSKTAEFVSSVLEIAPNGVLASAKVKAALLKLTQTNNKINRTRFCDTDWADHVDLRLRTILSQYRELKKKSDTYCCAMRKASEEEKVAIDKALALLRLDQCETAGALEHLQLVPYTSAPAAASSSQALIHSSSAAASSSKPSGGMGIWQRILQKRDSSPSKAVPAQQSVTASLDSQPKSLAMVGLQNQMTGPLCVPAEECTVSEASTPVAKKRSKFQKGQKTTLVKKAKGISLSADLGLDEEDASILEESLGQQISMEKPKRARAKKKKPGTKNHVKKRPASKLCLEKQTDKVKDEEAAKRKSSFRHRQTSTAKKQCKTQGKTSRLQPRELQKTWKDSSTEGCIRNNFWCVGRATRC